MTPEWSRGNVRSSWESEKPLRNAGSSQARRARVSGAKIHRYENRRWGAKRVNPGFPGWNRHFEAAFRSPRATVRLQATIPGSLFPTCFFNALLHHPQGRSAYGYFADTGSPRYR